MRGTRIRWDGALKTVGVGVAIVLALLVLPGLLAGEPPPPPDDVGLVTSPPLESPTPAPAPAPTSPAPPLATRPPRAGKPPKAPKPGRAPKSSRDEQPGAEEGEGEPAETDVAAASAPTYAPPAAAKERFGFER